MDISYASNKLKKFLDPSVLVKNLGATQAKSYTKVYNILKASSTFATYLETGYGRPEPMSGNELDGCYSIRLNANYRVIVRPEAETLSIIDLRECDSIEMKGVVDYHGAKYTWKTP